MEAVTPNFINTLIQDPAIIFRFGFAVFAVLYFIFTLVVIRQVNLMTQTVVTEGGFLLRLASYIYAVLGLGVLVFFILFL